VLVHGAGSFGHPQAAKYLLNQFNLSGLWKTHRSVTALNTRVVNELQAQNVPALPIHPLGSITLDAGRISHFEMKALHLMLRNGIVPVIHGDVALDSSENYNILSGDQILAFLAQKMRPDKIGIGTDVDGIILKGKTLDYLNADEFEKYRQEIVGSSATDVTGGMLRKVSELIEIAKSGIQSQIFNAARDGNVAKFLISDEKIGTTICAKE
jgi:isopentenyl phosphate kinase